MPREQPQIEFEDNSKYLTVVHPYPPNANLRTPADKRALACWLACCTGKDVLLAMYHKPTSAGMIIVEVDSEFEGFDTVLGKHSWDDFLLAPTEEEAGKSSDIFFCTYTTNKAVRDGGWRRVEIEEYWFQGWYPENDTIKFPYPQTTYCDVPSEAKTGAPMCRPLPRHFLASTASEEETPGIANAPSPALQSLPSLALSPAPISETTDHRGHQGDPSREPPFFVSVAASTPASHVSSGVRVSAHQGSSTYSPRGPAPPPATPPGLEPLPGLSMKTSSPQFGENSRPGLGAGQVPSSSRRPGPDATMRTPQLKGHINEDAPMPSTAVALADLFDVVPSLASDRSGGRPSGMDEEADAHGASPPCDQTGADGEATTEASLWVEYYRARKDRQREMKNRGWICPEHGSDCTPGICSVFGQVESDEHYKKEEEARKEARRKWQEERERRRARGRAQQSSDESEEDDPPPDEGSRSHDESTDSDPSRPQTPSNSQEPTNTATFLMPTTSFVPVVPTEGGFPTFAGTDWADPITAAQSLDTGKSSATSATTDVDATGMESDRDVEGDGIKVGQKPGQGRGSGSYELDFEVRPGSPGESWGDPDAVW